MPGFNFAAVAVNRASVAIDFGDGNVLHVDYYPDKLTTKLLLEMSANDAPVGADATPEQMRAKLSGPANALLALMASWDAVDTAADGVEVPLPLDLDHLSALPLMTLNRLLKAIVEDAAGEASAPTA